MTTGREIQPSCMSKTEYENSNLVEWKNIEKDPPCEGSLVFILQLNGELDKDFWTTEAAYYCDGEFYVLEYDPHLGILRKQHVSNKAKYWHPVYFPSYSDVND